MSTCKSFFLFVFIFVSTTQITLAGDFASCDQSKKYNKLVRDRIPEIIQQNGKNSKFRVAERQEYRHMLTQKLIEETQEFVDNPCEEELADVQEVVDAIQEEYLWLSVKAKKKFKKITRGSFKNKIILEEVIG